MEKGSIICFTGPSGVGKTSYAKRLIEKYISEIKKLECYFVYANYSENSWNGTFEEIKKIIFKKAK